MTPLARAQRWTAARSPAVVTALGYAALVAVLVTVFLYLTFPWDKLSNRIRLQAELLTGARIDVQQSRVRFPLQLVWNGVTVTPKTGAARVLLDQIAVEWPLPALLRRRIAVVIRIKVAGGDGVATLAVQGGARDLQYRLDGALTQLDLARVIRFWNPQFTAASGRIDVTIAGHDWVGDEPLRGTGRVEIEARDLRIEALDLTFDSAAGGIDLKGGVANIEAFEARGAALELVGDGTLLFRSSMFDSLVNLNARATVKQPVGILALLASPGNDAFDLGLRGPLRRPSLSVNGAALQLPPADEGA